MKEKLIIKNFGPIKSAELELGRFNVLIGEQATGKSTVAKLLAVCRYFSYIADTSISGYPSEHNFRNGLAAWGLTEFVKSDSYIEYSNIHYDLIVKQVTFELPQYDEDGTVDYHKEAFFHPDLKPKSSEFINLLAELEKIKPTSKAGKIDFELLAWTIPTSFLQNDVTAVLDNPFYIPAERALQSIFSLGKSSIQNISDALFSQLADLDRIARAFRSEIYIAPLDIVYKNVEGKGYIRKTAEKQFYSLYHAATGYQSSIPVVLTTKYFNERIKKSGYFIIEELEQNLFPSAQQRFVNYLVDSTLNFGNTVLLTTHSPYILTALNNLLYAYKTGQEHKHEVNKVIQEKYWLNPEDVSVYMMMPDGTCEDIVDREEDLIKAEKIDTISQKINEDFNALMEIEFTKNEFNTK